MSLCSIAWHILVTSCLAYNVYSAQKRHHHGLSSQPCGTDEEGTDEEATDEEATDEDATDEEATDEEATDEKATDEEATDEDCHILPLTGLTAFVYTSLNAQKL